MQRMNKLIYFIISMIFFVTFDLFFSDLLINSVRFNIESNPIIDLIFVQNTGAAFSILENFQFFLIVFAIVAIFLVVSYVIRNVENFSVFACFWAAMLVAGIGCNLYERISLGYVRDFFKLNFIDFPVFNISDVFINISVLALIVIIIKNKYIRK